jgi:Fic family protein
MDHFLSRIQKKKKQLDELRPLPKSILDNLRKGLSLEWTYNSNAIEGNTLSLQETRLVLEEGITIKGKSLREHFEAKNHEKAIQFLESFVQNESDITESQIFNLHRLVLDGIEQEYSGRYRNGQVRILGANFIPPSALKVPDLMTEYINELMIQRKEKDIVSAAAYAHHRFVWIHPFFDGNGRTARLIMNLVFMTAGYPPAIILRNDRRKYYEALNQANTGSYKKLILLIAQAIERSLDIYLSAIRGDTDSEYLPLSQLAPQTLYSAEYLGLLSRRGLIDAYKEGRNWVSTLKAVNEYRDNSKS